MNNTNYSKDGHGDDGHDDRKRPAVEAFNDKPTARSTPSKKTKKKQVPDAVPERPTGVARGVASASSGGAMTRQPKDPSNSKNDDNEQDEEVLVSLRQRTPSRRRAKQQPFVFPVEPRTIVSIKKLRTQMNHSYRDFSSVPPELDYQAPIDDLTFSQKVHEILSTKEYEPFVGWMSHGRAFRVHIPKIFEEQICSKYFGHSRYSSFLRLLNNYGFKHITQGPDRNCYYHECFLRCMPHLCKYMPLPKNARRLMPDPANEPDFYKISDLFPVPDRTVRTTADMPTGQRDQSAQQQRSPPVAAAAVGSAAASVGSSNVISATSTGAASVPTVTIPVTPTSSATLSSLNVNSASLAAAVAAAQQELAVVAAVQQQQQEQRLAAALLQQQQQCRLLAAVQLATSVSQPTQPSSLLLDQTAMLQAALKLTRQGRGLSYPRQGGIVGSRNRNSGNSSGSGLLGPGGEGGFPF